MRTRLRFAVWLSLGIFIVAGSIVGYLYQRDLSRAHALAESGSEMIATACGPIEAAIIGNGPPLLLVHGAGGGFDQSLFFARTLSERGIRIIAPSRFGYLRTPLPADASPAAQADAHA